MTDNIYTFTREQLNQLLLSTIALFLEYRDVHGKAETDGADLCAVNETFEGLDAEREMARDGLARPTMQITEESYRTDANLLWRQSGREHKERIEADAKRYAEKD